MYICFVIATKQLYKTKNIMYTEAFLFVGNLLQNGFIKKIKFGNKYFKVKFKDSNKFVPYEYLEEDIIVLLKDIEHLESGK